MTTDGQDGSRRRDEYVEWRGILVLVGGIILSNIPLYFFASIRPPVHTLDPYGVPWWFIYSGLYQGIGALIGLILAISLSIAMWRRFPAYSHLNLWMVLLWQGPKIVLAIYIYSQCQHLFDPSRAIAPWNNFNEYLDDWMVHWGRLIFVAVPMVIAFFPPALRKKKDEFR